VGTRRLRRSPIVVGAEPLPPRRKWRAITLSTLLLVPAFWTLLAGVVSVSSTARGGPAAGPLIAFGLAVIPFVFVLLAFLSEHPKAPGAVVVAMVLMLVVGIPVAALSRDVVSGFVAGIGAGGVAALRMDLGHTWQSRALAVAASTAFVFVIVRLMPEVAVVLTPILPFTAIGVADHLLDRRKEEADRQRAAGHA
jgi:hypothetical protein